MGSRVSAPLSAGELAEKQPTLFDVQIDPPSVPVESSERGAARAKLVASTQVARIITALERAGCVPNSEHFLSRDEIIAATKLSVNAACGRLGPSGPLLPPLPDRPRRPWSVRAVEDAGVSSCGERVIGYQLTEYGVDLARRLNACRQ